MPPTPAPHVGRRQLNARPHDAAPPVPPLPVVRVLPVLLRTHKQPPLRLQNKRHLPRNHHLDLNKRRVNTAVHKLPPYKPQQPPMPPPMPNVVPLRNVVLPLKRVPQQLRLPRKPVKGADQVVSARQNQPLRNVVKHLHRKQVARIVNRVQNKPVKRARVPLPNQLVRLTQRVPRTPPCRLVPFPPPKHALNKRQLLHTLHQPVNNPPVQRVLLNVRRRLMPLPLKHAQPPPLLLKLHEPAEKVPKLVPQLARKPLVHVKQLLHLKHKRPPAPHNPQKLMKRLQQLRPQPPPQLKLVQLLRRPQLQRRPNRNRRPKRKKPHKRQLRKPFLRPLPPKRVRRARPLVHPHHVRRKKVPQRVPKLLHKDRLLQPLPKAGGKRPLMNHTVFFRGSGRLFRKARKVCRRGHTYPAALPNRLRHFTVRRVLQPVPKLSKRTPVLPRKLLRLQQKARVTQLQHVPRGHLQPPQHGDHPVRKRLPVHRRLALNVRQRGHRLQPLPLLPNKPLRPVQRVLQKPQDVADIPNRVLLLQLRQQQL